MTDRRKRFVRCETPDGLVLTERDEKLLVACYEHQWLTRQQIQRLLVVPGVTRINQRLRALYDHGFLDRIRTATLGAGLQPVYLPGPAAVPLIADRTGSEPTVVRDRLRESARVSPLLLPHDLQLNDVRFALTEQLANTGGVRLDLWQNTPDSFHAYAKSRALRPDGYFRFWHKDVLSAFFLELDRGTTNLSRWKLKVERYQEYRDQGHYAARYGLQRFRVLVATPTAARTRSLAIATSSIVQRSFWFAPIEDILSARSATEPIWTPLGGNDPRALI